MNDVPLSRPPFQIHRAVLLLFLLVAAGCGPQKQDTSPEQPDPHSYANLHDVITTHMDLDIIVDFNARRIRGSASFDIEHLNRADSLILDTDGLIIDRVTGEDGSDAGFTLGHRDPVLGAPLAIGLTAGMKRITVHYSTGADAKALQWLDPTQTAGKKKPFLFTQSQAILARSWVPCQDSPGARVTYTARVSTRPDLMVLMSAENDTTLHDDGVYTFRMTHPVPPYLFALAVGDVRFRPLGPRSGVYAEPEMIDQAAWEFADTEKMIRVAEGLYGSYRWGRYDILVLPPSFPYGGMENPMLTFATPTVIVGDRSLTALVAHELAHSWSGNLVTNRTWEHFWLNEGFTTYFEHRIMESMYGREYDDMTARLDLDDLMKTLDEVGPDDPDTRLEQDLTGRDPDGVISTVAYEKGFIFLRLLEQSVGRDRWDPFLRGWFDSRAFKSATTTEFIAYLRENLIRGEAELEKKLRIEEWVQGTGLPSNAPVIESSELKNVDAALAALSSGTAASGLDTKTWTTHHWRYFLSHLPDTMTAKHMAELDGAFRFTRSKNSEILFGWLRHAIANRYEPAYGTVETFLISVGRRKFVRPLFERLVETTDGLSWAKRIYQKARPVYHPVTRNTVDRILGMAG